MIKLRLWVLHLAQNKFMTTWQRDGTEERLLVYRSPQGQMLLVVPEADRGPAHVECDVELTTEYDGVEFDLVADLHSHHIMGAKFSGQDDKAERLRGITFGVCSWRSGRFEWLFRRFAGEYQPLAWGEVVDDG